MTNIGSGLPPGKRTKPGLYMTAKEAYEAWKAGPDRVKIIDVRTPEEYLFVGHPTMAWKIPVACQTYDHCRHVSALCSAASCVSTHSPSSN